MPDPVATGVVYNWETGSDTTIAASGLNVPAGGCILLLVGSNSDDAASVSDGTTSATKLDGFTTTVGAYHYTLWKIENASANASATITATWSAGVSFRLLGVVAYDNVAAAAVSDFATLGDLHASSGDRTSEDLTTTSSKQIVVIWGNFDDFSVIENLVSGWNLVYNVVTDLVGIADRLAAAGTWPNGNIGDTGTYPASKYAAFTIALEPSAAGGSNSDGNASFTLGGITFAAIAENPFVGASFSLGAITFSATAEHPYYANASFTLGGITFAATAEHPYYADSDFTLGEITFTATATNQNNADGDAAFTLGAISFSALAAFGNSVSFTTSNIQFGSTGMLILYTNIQQSEVANDVYVCNLALGRLGEYQLMALTERTVPARNCNRFYLATVDEVLREHQWNFATGHATLSELATNPGATEWLHAYQLPSDFVRLRRLNNWTEEDEFTHWEIEKDSLLTDDDKAEIKYTRKITNVALWDPMAIEALSLKLAYKLAVPITGSMTIAQQLFAEYQQVVMPRAQRVDASEAKQRHKPAWATSALVQSRSAGS